MGKSEKDNQVQQLSAREQEYNESFVMLPKAFLNPMYDIQREPLKDFEVAVYLVVDAMRTSLFEAAVLDVKGILKILGYYPNTANIARVKEALLVLQKEGIIIVSDEKECNSCLLSIATKQVLYIKRCFEMEFERGNQKKFYIYKQNEGFTKIFSKDIYKMLNSSVTFKDKLIRIYIEIMKRIFITETNPRISYPSVEKLSGDTGFDRKTVMKMINELYEIEVIICIQLQYKEKTRNFYSRPIHHRELRSFVRGYAMENKNVYGTPKVIYLGKWEQEFVAS